MFIFNGRKLILPGAYSLMQVINQGGGAAQEFNVGLIIGKSMKGAPYNSSAKATDFILPYTNNGDLARDYGFDELYNNFNEAKKLGASFFFVLNAQANTPVIAELDNVSEADVIGVTAARKNYGIFGNDIQIGIAESASTTVLDTGTATAGASTTLTDSGKTWTESAYVGKWVRIVSGTGAGQTRRITANTATALTVAAWTTNPDTTSVYNIVEPLFQVTIIPTKNEKVLTANMASGSYFCYVNTTEGLAPGLTFNLFNNDDSFVAARTVESFDTEYDSTNGGYKVIFTAVTTNSNMTTAKYGRISQVGEAVTLDFVGNAWNLDNIVTYLNENQDELVFSKVAGETTTPVPIATTYLSALSTTKGTNPAVSVSNHTEIVNNFRNWIPQYENLYRTKIRNINVVSSNSTIHALYKNLLATVSDMEVNRPMQIITGTARGTNAASSVTLAKAMNHDQIILVNCGANGKACYLSLAPMTFGAICASAVNHNLTRDLMPVETVEFEWSNADLKLMTANGVLTINSTATGYRIVRGINTYQDQTKEWNSQDKKSHLIQQRQQADKFMIGFTEAMDQELIGKNGVREPEVIAYANATATAFIEAGDVEDVKISSVRRTSSGWLVTTEILLEGVTDYIGIVNQIIVRN